MLVQFSPVSFNHLQSSATCLLETPVQSLSAIFRSQSLSASFKVQSSLSTVYNAQPLSAPLKCSSVQSSICQLHSESIHRLTPRNVQPSISQLASKTPPASFKVSSVQLQSEPSQCLPPSNAIVCQLEKSSQDSKSIPASVRHFQNPATDCLIDNSSLVSLRWIQSILHSLVPP